MADKKKRMQELVELLNRARRAYEQEEDVYKRQGYYRA